MKTVLICDDMATDRELVGQVVVKMGCKAEYAVNGTEVVEMAKTLRPDLILLDVVMPDGDGFRACRALKKQEETQDIPVVLVTTKGTEADQFWGKKQGADDHLVKPFSPDELGALVQRYTA